MSKSYYKKVQEQTIKKLNNHKGMFSCAVIADSHLDNSVPDTCENIRIVSEGAKLDCVLHLGDIMCGGFPRKTLNRLMCKEIDLFRSATKDGCFYPSRGNHDGFRNPINGDSDVRLDCDWCDVIGYIDSLPGVSHPEGMPYFYVDYPEYSIRLISLNSFFFREVDGEKVKGNINGYDDNQLEWFRNEALNVSDDVTVLVLSHDSPVKNFNDNFRTDNPIYNGNAMLDAVIDGRKKRGFKFAAWLVGHYHGDLTFEADGINIVLVASETAYIPSLFDMPDGGNYPPRELGTSTEDLWDALCIDTDRCEVHLFRFGSGRDRIVSY